MQGQGKGLNRPFFKNIQKTDTCCMERIETGLKKDQEEDLGFQKGVVTLQKTSIDSDLLLYLKNTAKKLMHVYYYGPCYLRCCTVSQPNEQHTDQTFVSPSLFFFLFPKAILMRAHLEITESRSQKTQASP